MSGGEDLCQVFLPLGKKKNNRQLADCTQWCRCVQMQLNRYIFTSEDRTVKEKRSMFIDLYLHLLLPPAAARLLLASGSPVTQALFLLHSLHLFSLRPHFDVRGPEHH